MHYMPQSAIFLLLLSACSACTTAGSADGKAPKEAGGIAQGPKADDAPKAASVRVVTQERAGRALEILDEHGNVLATFVPEDFTQRLLVPDIANNSSELIAQDVPGSDVLTASLEPSTRQVLVGVRGFLYAEVSTDLVFVLELGTEENAKASAKILPVYLDGPEAADDGPAPRPQLDVSRVSFGAARTIEIEVADASGGTGKLLYSESRVPASCAWQGGESPRCPKGLRPKGLLPK
jgi:hypothetical protein